MMITSLLVTGLPKDCEDARQQGISTGEVFIWPSTEIDPFLVYCDMNMGLNSGACTQVLAYFARYHAVMNVLTTRPRIPLSAARPTRLTSLSH